MSAGLVVLLALTAICIGYRLFCVGVPGVFRRSSGALLAVAGMAILFGGALHVRQYTATPSKPAPSPTFHARPSSRSHDRGRIGVEQFV